MPEYSYKAAFNRKGRWEELTPSYVSFQSENPFPGLKYDIICGWIAEEAARHFFANGGFAQERTVRFDIRDESGQMPVLNYLQVRCTKRPGRTPKFRAIM